MIERGAGANAAAIELDGVAVGDSSVGVEVPLDPGPHAVTAKAPNRKPFEANVTLKEERRRGSRSMLEELPPEVLRSGRRRARAEKPPSKVVPFVIGGVGVASLIGSGVLFGLRQSTLAELEDACGADGKHCPPSKQSRYDDLKFYHYGSMVTLGVGVAAVGTAGALLFFQRKKKEPAPPTRRPHLQARAQLADRRAGTARRHARRHLLGSIAKSPGRASTTA